MRRFELTKELLTGVDAIDKHHRTLLELGNRVIDPSAIKTDGPIFEDAIKFLSDYVMYQFAAEEYVMIESHYPNFEHHHRWHERFKGEVSAYADQAAVGGTTKDLKLKVSFAIENWMMEHIQITDRSLVQYLQQQQGSADIRLPSVRSLMDKGKLPGSFTERLVWARG